MVSNQIVLDKAPIEPELLCWHWIRYRLRSNVQRQRACDVLRADSAVDAVEVHVLEVVPYLRLLIESETVGGSLLVRVRDVLVLVRVRPALGVDEVVDDLLGERLVLQELRVRPESGLEVRADRLADVEGL